MKPITNTLTEKQQSIIDTAIELLSAYDKEEVSYTGYYLLFNGDDGNPDHDTCNNEECRDKELQSLKEDYPNDELEYLYGDMNNDETFNRCCQCNKMLHSNLNGMEQEFNHYSSIKLTKEILQNSDDAFCISNMLRTFPTYEYEIKTGHYELSQYNLGNEIPYHTSITRQKEFYEKVVTFAQKVINILQG